MASAGTRTNDVALDRGDGACGGRRDAMISSPFRASRQMIDGQRIAMHEARGIARLEAEAIVLEFRERIQTMGSVSYSEREGELESATIPLDAIGEVRWRWSWRGPEVVLELDRLSASRDVPWADGGTIVLRIPWRRRLRGRELAGEAALALADRRLRQLNAGSGSSTIETDDDASLP
jgi:hypothetical protein